MPTVEEAKLWAYLRGNQLGYRFRRQDAIGPYIADFCCIQKKLVVELDGSPHLEQGLHDTERTTFSKEQGYTVRRFWNSQVMNDIDGVIRAILFALDEL